VVVPHTLISESEIEKAMAENSPEWKPGHFSDGTPDTSPENLTRPFTLRRLSNGIRVGVAQNSAESQVRLFANTMPSFGFSTPSSHIVAF
jgi:hypothetical protein